MRQPWSIHHKRKLLKKRASTPPTLPPTCENSETTTTTNNNNQHSSNVVVGSKGSYLPSALTDSLRSEEGSEGDFFLVPFDEEEEEESTNAAEQQQRNRHSIIMAASKNQEKQKNRNQAMALLGEFFSLGNVEGEDSDETTKSTTTTTKVANAATTAVAIHSSPTCVMDFDAAESISSPSSSPKFMALSRANSLPLERRSVSSSTTHLVNGLTKRPSLKKISSIGKFHTSQSENSLIKRSVSFSKVAMREYNVALSDHPSCSYGPPVQLSWDYKEKEEQNLDSYETARQRQRKGSVNDLVLSYYDRRFMLIKQAGYSKREVKEAVKEVERVKRERMVTDMFLPASHLEETIGSFVDTVKGVFQKQQRPAEVSVVDTTVKGVFQQQRPEFNMYC